MKRVSEQCHNEPYFVAVIASSGGGTGTYNTKVHILLYRGTHLAKGIIIQVVCKRSAHEPTSMFLPNDIPATLGHTEPDQLLQAIHHQLCSIENGDPRLNTAKPGRFCGGIRQALYVSLDGGKSMDAANEVTDQATLYQIDLTDDTQTLLKENEKSSFQSSCLIVKRGTLKEVNEYCREQQKIKIAKAIREEKVHGLICISCHTEIFRDTLQAASMTEIPVTGSGGTSLSKASNTYGIHLIGNAGGSVATTTHTRAVSYTHAFASYWNGTYQPWKKKCIDGKDQPQANGGPAMISILNACLPAFWGVCLTKYVLRILMNSNINDDAINTIALSVRILEEWLLPATCCAIMAMTTANNSTSDNQRNRKQESATTTTSLMMSAIIASSVCRRSILSGLLAGSLISTASERILYWCIFHNVPATMTNLLSAGGTGALLALFMQPIIPLLRFATTFLRNSILSFVVALPLVLSTSIPVLQVDVIQAAFGGLLGILSCYGSKIGYYHAIHLPLILIEMEMGDASFLGAIDELTLVLVCAGICSGNLLAKRVFMLTSENVKKDDEAKRLLLSDADVSLSTRGLRINLLYGDFIEACYPFMEKSLLINAGGYAGSFLSCAYLVYGVITDDAVPKSLAYLPFPMSIMLAGESNWVRYLIASLMATGVPFLSTFLHHYLHRRHERKKS